MILRKLSFILRSCVLIASESRSMKQTCQSRLTKNSVLALLLSVATVPIALADVVPQNFAHTCNPTDVLEHINAAKSTQTQVAILENISQTEFNSIRRGLAGGATFVLGGIPINGTTTYDEFQKRASEFKRLYRLDLSNSESQTLSWDYLQVQAFGVISECIRSRRSGLFLLLERQLPDLVQVRIMYGTTESDNTTRHLSLSGTNLPDKALPAKPLVFRHSLDRSFTFAVENNSDRKVIALTALVEEDNKSETVIVLAPPKAPKYEKKIQKFGVGSGGGSNPSLRPDKDNACMKPDPGYQFSTDYTESNLVTHINHADLYVAINQSMKICVYGDASEQGGASGAELEVTGYQVKQ